MLSPNFWVGIHVKDKVAIWRTSQTTLESVNDEEQEKRYLCVGSRATQLKLSLLADGLHTTTSRPPLMPLVPWDTCTETSPNDSFNVLTGYLHPSRIQVKPQWWARLQQPLQLSCQKLYPSFTPLVQSSSMIQNIRYGTQLGASKVHIMSLYKLRYANVTKSNRLHRKCTS